jgi:2'-5' RNA ligase
MDASSKPLRLFFGIPVTEEVRAAATGRMAELAALGADAKWVEPRNLHLTLHFLGATPPERLPELERKLDDAARGRSPFSLELDRLGRFGSKVLWAGVGEGAGPLKSLAAALGAEAEGFVAHLTLARLRSARGSKKLLAAVDAAEPLRWSCPVSEVVLYSSVTAAGGPVYEPLRRRILGE